MALVVNCRVIANFRHKKTALGGLIKYAVIFYKCPGFFIVYAAEMNNYLLINLIAFLSRLHISITFNRCSLYLTLSPNVIDLGGSLGTQSFNRFAGIG